MTRHAATFTPADLTRRQKRDLQREIAQTRREDEAGPRVAEGPARFRSRRCRDRSGPGIIQRRLLESREGDDPRASGHRRSTSPGSTRSSPTPASATAAPSSAST